MAAKRMTQADLQARTKTPPTDVEIKAWGAIVSIKAMSIGDRLRFANFNDADTQGQMEMMADIVARCMVSPKFEDAAEVMDLRGDDFTAFNEIFNAISELTHGDLDVEEAEKNS